MRVDFNPTPSEDYATLRRQFGALVRIVRGMEAQSLVNHEKIADLRNEASLSNKEAIEALRTTNEKLTNINESLESHNRDLLAANQVLRDALQAAQEAIYTYDYTGTKLDSEKYIKAERLCAEAIALNPGDIALIEVGTFHHTEYSVSPNIDHDAIEPLPHGKHKLYTIQTKSNTE